MSRGGIVEFMYGYKFLQLREYRIMMAHDLNSSVIYSVFLDNRCNNLQGFKPFFSCL